MLLGHVLGRGGVPALQVGAAMAGDPLPPVEAFDGAGGGPEVELKADEGIGDGVVVPVERHVIVDVDADLLPGGELAGLPGQGLQGGPVDLLEEFPAATGQLAEGLVVEFLQQPPDLRVGLRQGEELPVAQGREDPALRKKHAQFHLGLVIVLQMQTQGNRRDSRQLSWRSPIRSILGRAVRFRCSVG